MKTYRYRGHSRTDPAKYRPEGELERWQGRDPIALLGASLAEDGALDEQSATALRAEIQEMVDETATRAKQAPFPTLEEIREYVYAA
jgi:pyruvate dehydrogenase E1 component alpha subunit